jgi:hypothetical protein
MQVPNYLTESKKNQTLFVPFINSSTWERKLGNREPRMSIGFSTQIFAIISIFAAIKDPRSVSPSSSIVTLSSDDNNELECSN